MAHTRPSHTRPRPGRRRNNHLYLPLGLIHTLAFTGLVLLSLCAPTYAAAAEARASRTQKLRGRFLEGEIIFDRRPVPQPALYRRAEASNIPAPSETATITGLPESTMASSGSLPTSIETAPTESSAPLPKPFDGGLGTNYTQPSCPTFLTSMINNDTFTSCLPFSLLLQVSSSPLHFVRFPTYTFQNSMSFFQSTKSLSSITETLNASCDIVFPECSSIISSYALNLRSNSACSQDYNLQNPIVRQAYAGLISYDVLYHASCTKNLPPSEQNNNNYCFANAVTNITSPTDSYIYYLPLGIPLPASSQPTCDQCLKDTMGIFSSVAGNKTQPLSLDYVNAAQLLNQNCGPNFVNGTIPSLGASGSGQTTTSDATQAYRVGLLGAAVTLVTSMLLVL